MTKVSHPSRHGGEKGGGGERGYTIYMKRQAAAVGRGYVTTEDVSKGGARGGESDSGTVWV